MDLSIIIVNWHSAGYVRQCLASIYKNTAGLKFEIIVVDNASYDGCDEMLKAGFPEVRYVQSERNLGFAAANNLGYQYAAGENILLLNPDTELIGNALAAMTAQLNSLREAGAIGCTLLNSDFSLQTSCVQVFPSLLTQALDAEILRRLFPRWKIWGMQPLLARAAQPAEVEVISGACLMVKRSVFEKAGLMSTEYFMYAEDVDLCYKIRQNGFKVYYTAAATVVHHGGKSTEKKSDNFSSSIVMTESLAQFFKKTRGKFYAGLYRMSMALAALARLLLIALASLGVNADRRSRLWNFSARKWRLILRWSLGVTGVEQTQPGTRQV